MHKKPHLPEKMCPVCQRPFSWRKKWEKNWESVTYCSHACRTKRKPHAPKEDSHETTQAYFR